MEAAVGSTKNDKVRVSPHCPIGQAVSSLDRSVHGVLCFVRRELEAR